MCLVFSGKAHAQVNRLTISSSLSSLTDTSISAAQWDILSYDGELWYASALEDIVAKSAGTGGIIIRGAAGALTTTGTYNIVIGEASDPANSGSENVLIGKSVVQAGWNNSHLVAIGSNITTGTLSEDSVIIGYQATVNVLDAIAIGPQANVSGRHGTAVGDDTDAGHGSVALGMGSQALPADTGATAVGRNAIASGNFSTALGHTTTASYDSSTAVGYEATTTAIDQIMLGSAGTKISMGGNITFQSGISYAAAANLTPVTVATLGTPTAGTLKIISDGASATDCVTGSGSTYNLCLYNGSAWIDP